MNPFAAQNAEACESGIKVRCTGITFADLERFFPSENFRTLEDIERFHQKLAKILADEFAETEKDLATTYYDFLGMAGQIEAYCNKNQIAPKTSSRIQLAFEETAQMLVSMIENPRIQAVCEYSETTETAEWMVSYGGQRLDVTESGDDLALTVLKGITEEMKYNWNENAELPNQLSLKIQRT